MTREKVVIGPIYPALEEPIQFNLMVENEKIINVNFEIGFHHRGVEKLALKRNIWENILLMERICGICSHAHTLCYCQAIEKALNIQVPPKAKHIRVIISELERIHSHMLILGAIMHSLNFHSLFNDIMINREVAMEAFDLLCGNRVHYGINTIGGVRRDFPEKPLKRILENLEELETFIKATIDNVENRREFQDKMENVGVITKSLAKKLDVIGPVARASGIPFDIRKHHPYESYENIGFEIITKSEGDVKARTLIRFEEILQSIRIIDQAVDYLLNEKDSLLCSESFEIVSSEGVGRVEAPRGELFYYVSLNDFSIPERVKMRTPTFANIPVLSEILIGEKIELALGIINSIDPCIACLDRSLIIESRREKNAKSNQ